MKILLIDNYDSFTYNLYQYLKRFESDVSVYKNDELTIEAIEKLSPDKIVISPGPGTPDDAGISKEVVLRFGKVKPILGVCLGHQVIANAFGAKIIKSETPAHGKAVRIDHDGKGVYSSLPQKVKAGLYHSLTIDEKSLSGDFIISARSEQNKIMGIRHKRFPLEGTQFHPESILTQRGYDMIENWIYER
ncbi:MAG: aminodeoxychorismate/anthranilate synthase component II [Chlorobi bacterium]|nr:aminodeoxychorismate/anthranilate synthase component II [Chlorobiota bacterium]